MDKPFQTYDDTSDAAACAPRLKTLRAELARRGLDGFVVPHSDQHMGEYLPAFAERLASAEAKEAFTAFFEKRKPNFGT